MPRPFSQGQIVELSLKRFMIYSTVATFKFRPGLNAFLGVNGSGKSSVFVGLYLGLGGDLRDLKRQKLLQDLIHRGAREQSAEIVVKIAEGEDESRKKSKVRFPDSLITWVITYTRCSYLTGQILTFP